MRASSTSAPPLCGNLFSFVRLAAAWPHDCTHSPRLPAAAHGWHGGWEMPQLPQERKGTWGEHCSIFHVMGEVAHEMHHQASTRPHSRTAARVLTPQRREGCLLRHTAREQRHAHRAFVWKTQATLRLLPPGVGNLCCARATARPLLPPQRPRYRTLRASHRASRRSNDAYRAMMRSHCAAPRRRTHSAA